MPIHKNRFHSFFACAAALSCFAGSSARADSGAGSLSVDLEISQRAGKEAPETMSATLVLVGDHGCASLDARHGRLSYDLEVCRDGGDPSNPVLRVHVNRSESSSPQPSSAKFKVTGQLRMGQRTLLGRLHYSDGVETLVSAAVR